MWFMIHDILKIGRKRLTDSLNQLITEVLVEQPGYTWSVNNVTPYQLNLGLYPKDILNPKRVFKMHDLFRNKSDLKVWITNGRILVVELTQRYPV